MPDVDVHLISAWADRVLDAGSPWLKYLHPDQAKLEALGRGFSRVRESVLGEGPGLVPSAIPADRVAEALEYYLFGIAQGIDATGADREPSSLVAGLITGAAQLRFSWTPTPRCGAVELAERAGVAAADAIGEGADLAGVLRTALQTMDGVLSTVSTKTATSQDTGSTGSKVLDEADHELSGLLFALIESLGDVVLPTGRAGRATRRPLLCQPRRFLAEIAFQIDAGPGVHEELRSTLEKLGTDLRVEEAATEGVLGYHLHSTHPGPVVSEIYSLATPFDLQIHTLEPPLIEEDP